MTSQALTLVPGQERQLVLGGGHLLLLFGFASKDPNEIVGGLWSHLDPAIKGVCTSLIYFDVPATKHMDKEKYLVSSWDPLTMRKRITCYHCLTVGYIKDGLWKPHTPGSTE
jgi:hypothetical protein